MARRRAGGGRACQYGRAEAPRAPGCSRRAAHRGYDHAAPADEGDGMDLRQALFEIAAEHRLDATGMARLERIAGLHDEPRTLTTLLPRAVAVLAAATQRTSRIQLGTAVTPLGWENPLRLAEDWATVDVLSGGRLNPGFSVGPPARYEEVKGALYPDTAEAEDFSYARVSRLLACVRGEAVTAGGATTGFEARSEPQPLVPGVATEPSDQSID